MSEANDEIPDREVQKSTAEKLMDMQEGVKTHEAIALENAGEYRKALNSIGSSPNGQFVLKYMIKALGVFTVKPNRDGMALVADKANRDFYLTMIRPYLDKDLRQEIEP